MKQFPSSFLLLWEKNEKAHLNSFGRLKWIWCLKRREKVFLSCISQTQWVVFNEKPFQEEKCRSKKLFMSLNYIFQSIRMFYIFSLLTPAAQTNSNSCSTHCHATMTTRKCIRALSIVIHNAWSREKTSLRFMDRSVCWANERWRWASACANCTRMRLN